MNKLKKTTSAMAAIILSCIMAGCGTAERASETEEVLTEVTVPESVSENQSEAVTQAETVTTAETITETTADSVTEETTAEATTQITTTAAPEPVSQVWEEKPMPSFPMTYSSHIESGKEDKEIKQEAAYEIIEKMGLCMSREQLQEEDLVILLLDDYFENDFDGNGQTECFYAVPYCNKNDKIEEALIYSDNDGNGHELLRSTKFDKIKIRGLIESDEFSQVVVYTKEDNKYMYYIFSANGNGAEMVMSSESGFSVLQLDGLGVLCDGDNKLWYWDNEKKAYVELPECGDNSLSAEVRSELSDAIIESSNNLAMLHARPEYLTFNDYDDNGYYIYPSMSDEDREECNKCGYYYWAVDTRYAKTEDDLFNRIRRSISNEFVSDEKMKELLFGEFVFPMYGDYPKVDLTNYRTVNGQLELMQAYEPTYGFDLLPDTLRILEYNGDSAISVMCALDPGGDTHLLTFYMVKSGDNWQLYDLMESRDGLGDMNSYWE